MLSEDSFRTCSGRNPRRFELSDHLPSTNDDERLATVLDGIEQVREASRRFRRGDLRHEVRLSDLTKRRNGPVPIGSYALSRTVETSKQSKQTYTKISPASARSKPPEGSASSCA